MKRAPKIVIKIVAVAVLIAGVGLWRVAPVRGAANKVSSNTCCGSVVPPLDPRTSQITFSPTDAMQAIDTRDIKGLGLATDEDINADSMTLSCGAFTINTFHAAIVVETENQVGKFNYTPFTINVAQAGGIAPPINTQRIWCTVNLPQASVTWTYPNGFRLDEVAPVVNNVEIKPIVPLDNGRARVSWLFFDAETPPDQDGTCGTSACNHSDERYQYQFYNRQLSGLYPLGPSMGAGPTESTADDDDILVTTDRFMVTNSDNIYCYTFRVGDTAGNFGLKADTKEKCFVPDGKKPEFQRVEFYKDAAFNAELPHTVLGKYTVTSNPCFFRPGCEKDAGNPRLIYLKLVFSEPLFTGQFFGGATNMADDMFNRDRDGTTDEETGGFDNVDNDGDGLIDEDVSMTGCAPTPDVTNDDVDNDCDGFVDEEPNSNNGKDDDGDGAVDEDVTSELCASKQLWNETQETCLPSTRLRIFGSDVEGQVPGSGAYNTVDTLTWVCTKYDGNTSPICEDPSYATGTTVYRYTWDVSGPLLKIGLDEGDYEVEMVQGADGVGNTFQALTPTWGGTASMDNTPPTITLAYFKNPTMTTGFPDRDHDNDSGNPPPPPHASTPDMPVVPESNLYFRISLDDYTCATPTLAIYTPDSQTPPYEGEPQAANLDTVTSYTTCGQNSNCDPCTGDNCIEYDDEVLVCKTFRACYAVASTTINNGFASVGVVAKDCMQNSAWDEDDVHAAASQVDLDGLGDDTNGDGYPTYIPTSVAQPASPRETDAYHSGQYFAIDMNPPGPPAMSLPIRPCDGDVARQALSCDPLVPTTNSPSLQWAKLSDGVDNDNDSSTDEETYDSIDNDGDGLVDEDAVAPAGGTMAWEIGSWHLQVSSDPGFATTAEYFFNDTAVNQTIVPFTALPERNASEPYYWRIAAFDQAGNEGPFSPPTPKDYYTFVVDTTPPQFTITYFKDAARTQPLVNNANGIPVTKDTASESKKIYLTFESHESLTARPTFKVTQPDYGTTPIPTTPTTGTLPGTTFYSDFEVDAQGGGMVFDNGNAAVKITTSDIYGNALTEALPATGAYFFVDTEAPIVETVYAVPSPASDDNDGDGIHDEDDDDKVEIFVSITEDVVEPFRVRVMQASFPATPQNNDGIDNDCDGAIDEETFDLADNDGDTLIDEDYGSSGPVPGREGCLITMTRTSEGEYTGEYYVFQGYDGTAQLLVGNADSSELSFASDFAGNPAIGSGSMSVDTVPPQSPVPYLPVEGQYVKTTTPTLAWRVASRDADLLKYRIQLSTSATFAIVALDEEQTDDGVSTQFNLTVPADTDPGTPGDQPLADALYYWRVYAYDTAKNRSNPATATFTIDTQPPAVPILRNSELYSDPPEPNPTVYTSSPLSGKTEAGAMVDLYVNNVKIGSVTCDSNGEFSAGIDDDKDGSTDEDIVDGEDNDEDGNFDEDPIGVFLEEGDNIIEGIVTDVAGNTGSRGCSNTSVIYNATEGKCIITSDSGAPTFKVQYYEDTNLTIPMPYNTTSNRFVAKAGTIYLKIIASEILTTPPTYSINQQGSVDITQQNTTAFGTTGREFKASYTVNAHTGGTYVDGEAQVYVKGTDDQNNTTPDGILPSIGAYFIIDTQGSAFEVTYYSDSELRQPLVRDENLFYTTKAGSLYLRIVASEPQNSPPSISLAQSGSVDVTDADTTAYNDASGTSTVMFIYTYTVNEANGGSYVDGYATVTFEATDLAGNQVTGKEPNKGKNFFIDTTPPEIPSLVLPETETMFTQMDVSGTSESYSFVEIFIRGNKNMIPDDEIDNDGDGFIDEEPVNGKDDDNDMFVDEDRTAQTCGTDEFWDFEAERCLGKPADTRIPNGTDVAEPGTCGNFTAQSGCPAADGCYWDGRYCRDGDLNGTFATAMTGIHIGKNLVYVRATDAAGNVSDLSDPIELINNAPENVVLRHTFDPGWNLVGVPMQSSIGTPKVGLGVDEDVFRLQDGVYKYNSQLKPMSPGSCYWINFDEATEITLYGITSTTREITLKKGWNMIAVPYNFDVTWDENIIVKYQGNEYALGSTNADDYVDPIIYMYSPNPDPTEDGAYQTGVEPDDNVTLEPWIGFVIKAHEDCSLVFPYQ